jgi:hypothetical protein
MGIPIRPATWLLTLALAVATSRAQAVPHSTSFGSSYDGILAFTDVQADARGGAWVSGDVFARVDADGSVGPLRSMRIDGVRVRPIVGELAGGDILVAAQLPLERDTYFGFMRGPLAVARLAPDGSVRWSHVLMRRREPVDLAEGSDGSLWILEPDSGGTLHRFSSDGDYRESRRYSQARSDTLSAPELDLVAVDGGAVVLVSALDEPVVTRIEPGGRTSWSIHLPAVQVQSRGTGAAALDGRGGVVASWALEMGNGGSLVVTLDSAGRLVDQARVGAEDVDVWSVASGEVMLTGASCVRLSRGLDPLWVRTLPTPGAATAALAGGALVVAGTLDWDGVRGAGDADPTLTVRGPMGEAPPGCAPALDIVPSWERVALAPAPFVSSTAGRIVPITFGVATMEIVPEPLERYPWCDGAGCEADILDRDECHGQPSLATNGPYALNFCSDPEDRLLLPACAGIEHVVTTSGLGPQADTVLELWTEDCSTLLARDDDGGGGPASQLVFTPATDTTFMLVVRQADGTAGPGREYTLELDPVQCASATWTREFMIDDEPFLPVARTGHGSGWLILGELETSDAAALIRLGGDGSVTWCRRFDMPLGRMVVGSVQELSAGDILLGGYHSASGNPGRAWAARLTAAGDLAGQWAFHETGDDTTINYEGAVPRDGGFLVHVRRATGYTGTTVDALVSVDDSGAIRWTCPLGNRSFSWAPMSDGGAIVWSSGVSRPWIARLAGDGAVAWQRTIDSVNDGILSSAYVHFCREAAPGQLLLVGSTGYQGSTRLVLATLSADGTVAAERRFVFHQPDSRDPLPSAGRCRPMPDGGVAALLPSTLDGSYGDGLAVVGPDLEVRSARLSVADSGTGYVAGPAGFLAVGVWGLRPRMTIEALTPSGRRSPACDFSIPATWTDGEGQSITSEVNEDLRTATVVAATPRAVMTPGVVTWTEGCSTLPCPSPTGYIESITPPAPCRESRVRLVGSGVGRGSLTFDWDLDYDGTSFDVDVTGVSVFGVVHRAGPTTIALRVTDECPLAVPTIVTQVVDVLDASVPSIDGPPARCVGGPCVTLSLPAPWTTTSWPTGSTCVSPTITTTYSITATDGSGCSWPLTHVVEVALTPLAVSVRETCPGGVLELEALATGGRPPCSYAWDTGETSAGIQVAPGDHAVTVTDSLGCAAQATWTTTPQCGPPGEVSGPSAPPLLASGKVTTTISFEKLTSATSYNLLAGRIGEWLSPGASPSTCSRTTWTDVSDRLQGTERFASNVWFVVTASNAAGEGPAGAGFLGERSDSASWLGCGATR